MNKVLRKRFPREIRANLFRYLSLFLMIALCMYIIIAIVDAAEIIIQGTAANQQASDLEDGEVTVFTPLLAEQIRQIEAGESLSLTLSNGRKPKLSSPPPMYFCLPSLMRISLAIHLKPV